MKTIFFLLLCLPASAQYVTLGGLSAGASPPTNVATPTFSVAAGAVAPGTTVTPSTTTAGAVIAYTIDGTTPGCQTYVAGSANPILGTGTAMIYRHQIWQGGVTGSLVTIPDPAIYGPMTFKAIGCKNGLTPSAVATYAYTLTAPTGTVLSSCGTISSSGTYYLTSDLSSTGTCIQLSAANININLNGHTITYGTASGTVMGGTGMSMTNGSATIICSACTFTSALNGLKIFADNYNTGGYQNTADTTTVTYVNATTLTMSNASTFTTTNAEWFIANPPVYGVDCDPSIGGTCNSLTVYNGTITQGNVLDPPGSDAIAINPHNYSAVTGPLVFSGLTFNISAPEALSIYELVVNGADLVENDTINDSVTQIFYRDGLQYPIKFTNGPSPNTTPTKLVFDNQIFNSPQGGVMCDYTCYGWNNYTDNTTQNQYANGYAMFAGAGGNGSAANGSSFVGNTILGTTRGIELEQGNLTAQFNQVNVEDSATVQDPNHNPIGCEIDGGYGVRSKDFSSGVNAITNELIDSNLITVTTGPCGAQDVRYTLISASDSGVNSNNNYQLIANTNVATSSYNSADGAVMTNFTYSNETYSVTGPDATDIYDVYAWTDQASGPWAIPALINPKVVWYQGLTGTSSVISLTGTGTATCLEVPWSGQTGTLTLTFNGSGVSCP